MILKNLYNAQLLKGPGIDGQGMLSKGRQEQQSPNPYQQQQKAEALQLIAKMNAEAQANQQRADAEGQKNLAMGYKMAGIDWDKIFGSTAENPNDTATSLPANETIEVEELPPIQQGDPFQEKMVMADMDGNIVNASGRMVTPQSVASYSATSLPEDKGQLLNTLKMAAATTYPDNPVMQQVALSQAILESGVMGKNPSMLATKYNNLFGIKDSRNFPGTAGNVEMPSNEYIGGAYSKVPSRFSVNNSYEDSFGQHRNLMMGAGRYQPVVAAKTPEEAFMALGSSGYATDPNYAAKLGRIHNQYVSPLYRRGPV